MTIMNKNTHTTPINTTAPLFATDYNVYINHTDAGGIVYHANHLVFFENCRRDWFTKLGLNGYFLQTDDGEIQHFVVSQADLQYKKAILLDEVINVRIDKVELKPASIVFYQSIHRSMPTVDANDDTQANTAFLNSNYSNNTLLSSTKIVIACVQNQIMSASISDSGSGSGSGSDATANHSAPMRPIRVPQKLRETIEQALIQHANN